MAACVHPSKEKADDFRPFVGEVRRANRAKRRFALVLGAVLLAACDAPSAGVGGRIEVRREAREVVLDGVFHRTNAEKGTWHLLVHESGAVASLACFTTGVTPLQFYEQLRVLGFEDQNSITCESMAAADAATAGDALEYLFSWTGGPERVPLAELLTEVVPATASAAERRGLVMRFGGNHTGGDAAQPPSHRSGCLACLYTCCAGVTSNSRANLDLLRRENGEHRYRLNPAVDLKDGTRVQIIVRRKT